MRGRRLLEDTHIVDLIIDGESCGIDTFAAAPSATPGEVEDYVEILVEGPVDPCCGAAYHRVAALAVDIPRKLVRGPLYGIDMEIIVGSGRILQRHRVMMLVVVASVVLPGVGREVNDIGIISNVLHDIDFARTGPCAVHTVVGEEPDCGPCTFHVGELRADINTAVGEFHLVFRVDAAGGVLTHTSLFGIGIILVVETTEMKQAIGYFGIFDALAGVVLKFAIADISFLVVPIFGIL